MPLGKLRRKSKQGDDNSTTNDDYPQDSNNGSSPSIYSGSTIKASNKSLPMNLKDVVTGSPTKRKSKKASAASSVNKKVQGVMGSVLKRMNSHKKLTKGNNLLQSSYHTRRIPGVVEEVHTIDPDLSISMEEDEVETTKTIQEKPSAEEEEEEEKAKLDHVEKPKEEPTSKEEPKKEPKKEPVKSVSFVGEIPIETKETTETEKQVENSEIVKDKDDDKCDDEDNVVYKAPQSLEQKDEPTDGPSFEKQVEDEDLNEIDTDTDDSIDEAFIDTLEKEVLPSETETVTPSPVRTERHIPPSEEQSTENKPKETPLQLQLSSQSIAALLVSDISILSFLSIMVLFLSYAYSADILACQVPLIVASSWIILAFLIGFVLSSILFKTRNAFLPDGVSSISPIGIYHRRARTASDVTEFNLTMELFRHSILEGTETLIDTIYSTGEQQQIVQTLTNLNPKRIKHSWEANANQPVDEFLIRRLLKEVCHEEDVSLKGKNWMEEINPMCSLRGVDVFLSDEPVTEIYKHALLNCNGLRNHPTFLINVIVPWGNVAIYMQLPDWVKRFDDIQEEDDDSEQMKVFKKFLKGDNEYRSNHLQILPCVPVAPLPIRVIAPSKKELTIEAKQLSIQFHQEKERIENVSKAAILEMDVDARKDPLSRQIMPVLGRYLKNVDIHLAFVLSSEGKKCCLGMTKFSHVDLAECAVMPCPTEKEEVSRMIAIMEEEEQLLQ